MTDFRPKTWGQYIGQEKTKERLEIAIQASKKRGSRMEHVFLYGPPGSGKTSLASVMAVQMGATFSSYVMPLSEQSLKQMVIQNYGVVLLDEIHRASKTQQEALLTLVEDGVLNQKSGFALQNTNLTIVAATTERGKVIKPLYDRFPIKPKFEDYTDDEMGAIAYGMLKKAKLHSKYDMEFARDLGLAAGGVPRNVKSMIVAVRDLIDSGSDTKPSIETVLDIANVTADGLTDFHVDYLIAMGKNSGEGLGIKPLATQLQASEAMVLDAESLLFARNLITYTRSGRQLSPAGWRRAQELM